MDFTTYADAFRDWTTVLGIFSAIVLGVAAARPILIKRLDQLARRTRTRTDDAIVAAIRSTRMWLVVLFAAAVALRTLPLPPPIGQTLGAAATLAVFVQLGLWATTLWQFWLGNSRVRALKTNAAAATSLSAVGFIGEIVLWSVVALAALDNLGVNITTLVAGLGVGGIAVALAVQNILGDLFASLSIVIDKPFVIGDFVIVEEYMGTIENVGLKTTRVRSLGGEQIIFSNSDLLKTRLRNYKRMFERRVVLTFGVTYDTPAERLEEITRFVRTTVEAQKKVRFDRAHFAKFGESSLDFEVVYWVLDPDYGQYMDIQQAINLAIKRQLDDWGVGFAFPTRTLHIEGIDRLLATAARPRDDSTTAAARDQPRH